MCITNKRHVKGQGRKVTWGAIGRERYISGTPKLVTVGRLSTTRGLTRISLKVKGQKDLSISNAYLKCFVKTNVKMAMSRLISMMDDIRM